MGIIKVKITDDVKRDIKGEWITSEDHIRTIYFLGVPMYTRTFNHKTIPIDISKELDKKIGF